MPRKYTRLEQRRYREKRRAQAARVAERLMGKKKVNPDVEDFFSGRHMMMPIQYGNINVTNPRMSSVIYGMNGV